MIIDTHAHPDFCRLPLDTLVKNARDAGVERLVSVAVDVKTTRASVQHAQAYPEFIWPTAGIHPTYVPASDHALTQQLDELEALIQAHAGLAIGECGLDFYRDSNPPDAQQRRAFMTQLDLACAYARPVIIHSRAADEQMLPILLDRRPRAVIHCFSSPWSVASALLDTPVLFSFTGMITYASYNTESIKKLPLDRIMIETDAPYLTPQAYKGTPNQPAYVHAVCERIAAIKGLEYAQVAQATTATAYQFFNA